MPIYESEQHSQDKLQELRKSNCCAECWGRLDVFMDLDNDKAFLACADWRRSHHEGIMREASLYEQKGLESLNIPTRREIMEQRFGDKGVALERYHGVTSLSKEQAKEILLTVFPDAPEVEMQRAVLLCASYSLNPLMGHVFLIPFNKGEKDESWATVIGIKAKRLLASRKRPFSYVDDTPRVMTEEEQVRRYGKVKTDKLVVIVKLKDPSTGADGVGYGEWVLKKKQWNKDEKKYEEVDNEPFGTNKGNSMFNMATIRAESQALDRLCPGEMPMGLEVVDESYMQKELTDELEPKPKVIDVKPEPTPPAEEDLPVAQPEELKEQPKLDFDPDWLLDSIKKVHWKEQTVKSWCRNIYKVNGAGKPLDTNLELIDLIASLKREDREAFFNEVSDRIGMA